jgi:hypothetical protein
MPDDDRVQQLSIVLSGLLALKLEALLPALELAVQPFA